MPYPQDGRPAPYPVAGPGPFQPTLPVTETDYPNFWRAPAWRWWRPVVALLLAIVLVFIAIFGFVTVAILIDSMTGRVDPLSPDFDPNKVTALGFLANNLGLAALIPITLLVSWLVFKQRPGFTMSVIGSLRWGWLARCVLVILPLWVGYTALDTWLSVRAGASLDLALNRDTWVLIIGILLTTPFQAAGEEFGFRGLINRSIASFFRKPLIGLLAGGLVSTLAFTAAHGALDPWLNVFYFCFGVAACYITWRTGGLEGAIAIHVVNNMCAEVFLPFSDITGMFNREVGVAGPQVLLGVAVLGLGTWLILWQAKRQGIVRTAAPGASMQASLVAATAPPPLARPAASGAPLDNPRPWDDDSQVRR